jgi:glycosyltransferase involved in cell wall biosynthesis
MPPRRRPHRPRVLFLACHLPWPPLSGGRRRELELLRRLTAHFDIHLVVVSKTPAEDMRNVSSLASMCHAVEIFPAAAPPANYAGLGEPLQILRHRSTPATTRIREILAGDPIDLVHVEGFYLMQHVPEWVEAPVLLVEQNIEYELEYQHARCCAGNVTRLDSFARCVRTHDAELACWRRATRLATVTWEDREVMRAAYPEAEVSVVPDGADHIRAPDRDSRTVAVERAGAPVMLLLANFGYAPNVDAALHFAREILPAVRAAVEDARVWLVGNAPPPEVLALASEHLTVTGYVPDVVPYLDAADVIACPLRIGGGIKVKTIEALRRGKAIVSTAIGAQGLPMRAREAMILADEPRAFAEAVATLLQDERRRATLEQLARGAADMLPTWDESARALTAVYRDLLARATAKPEAVEIMVGRST